MSATTAIEYMSSQEIGFAEQQQSFRLHLIGRAVTCLAVLTILAIAGLTIRSMDGSWPIVVLMFLVLGLTGPYRWLGRRHPARLRELSLAIIVIEIGFLTCGEYLLGGRNAVYGLPLYGILVAMAATLHSGRAAYAVAILGAVSYAALAFTSQAGLIPVRRGPSILSIEQAWPISSALVCAFLGLATAAVVSLLSAGRERALAHSEATEEELRRVNRGLEKRIEEAVAAVQETNEALRDRNRELADSFRHVEILARAVSHDLRNPITAASEALRLGTAAQGPRGRELLGIAAANLARADNMLLCLRDLMRASLTPPVGEALDVRSVLEELLEEFRAQAGMAKIPVRLVGDLGMLRANRELILHVFRNLIGNALKHNRGRDDLLVEVGQDATGCYFVRDNGRGIPSSQHGRIFEPFRKGLSATDEGLGMGLSVVAAIVRQAGGSVTVESSVEQGAELRFSWPLRE